MISKQILILILLTLFKTVHCDLRIITPTETLDFGVTVTSVEYADTAYTTSAFLASTTSGLKRINVVQANPTKMTQVPVTTFSNFASAPDQNQFTYIQVLLRPPSDNSILLVENYTQMHLVTFTLASNTITRVTADSTFPQNSLNCHNGSMVVLNVNNINCMPRRYQSTVNSMTSIIMTATPKVNVSYTSPY